MRLAGQTKSGFYPAAPEAIAAILGHLKLPPDPPPDERHRISILDPCAGEGQALADIHQGLSLWPNTGVDAYAVELNASRAERLRAAFPHIRLVGPCSFHSTQITRHAFGLVYCNPPFDDEFGGGQREELSFVERCSGLLCLGGVLVLVLPFNQVLGNSKMIEELDTWYEQTELYLFPDGHRPFRECVVFGVRRKQAIPGKLLMERGELHRRGFRYHWARDEQHVADIPRLGQHQYDHWKDGRPLALSRRAELNTWTIPYAWAPKQFSKTELTAEEIEVELARSPLYRKLKTRVHARMRRPPLPLNKGHTSLVLLSGLLDGYVPSDPPHVVRGYCGKEKKLTRTESHTTPAGTHVEKRVHAEQPNPICRAVWSDGVIRTFSERKPETGNQEEEFEVESEGESEDDE